MPLGFDFRREDFVFPVDFSGPFNPSFSGLVPSDLQIELGAQGIIEPAPLPVVVMSEPDPVPAPIAPAPIPEPAIAPPPVFVPTIVSFQEDVKEDASPSLVLVSDDLTPETVKAPLTSARVPEANFGTIKAPAPQNQTVSVARSQGLGRFSNVDLGLITASIAGLGAVVFLGRK